jgi:hypothetical protein
VTQLLVKIQRGDTQVTKRMPIRDIDGVMRAVFRLGGTLEAYGTAVAAKRGWLGGWLGGVPSHVVSVEVE